MSDILNLSTVEQTKELMGDNFSIMVECFLEDTQTYIAEINEGIEENDSAKIKMASHTIKSSSFQLGAEGLSGLSKQIEEHCINAGGSSLPDDEMQKIKSLIAEIEDVFPKVSESLKQQV